MRSQYYVYTIYVHVKHQRKVKAHRYVQYHNKSKIKKTSETRKNWTNLLSWKK